MFGKIIKVRCDICHNKMATWEYVPRGYEYYCDSCVPRGCSCNIDENGVEETDGNGLKIPCCEFWYSRNGWTANHLVNDNSSLKWVNKLYVKSNKRSFSKTRFIYSGIARY
jgi:hypothetical protein